MMFRRAREERGRRSNGSPRSGKRGRRGTPRTKPGRRSPRLRRPIPRRAPCAFPTAQFVPPTTQIAAAPKEGVIVSIELTDRRNDAGLAGPMVDDIVRRYGRTPERLLVDTSWRESKCASKKAWMSAFAGMTAYRDDGSRPNSRINAESRSSGPECLRCGPYRAGKRK
jgi:hypothetical protein